MYFTGHIQRELMGRWTFSVKPPYHNTEAQGNWDPRWRWQLGCIGHKHDWRAALCLRCVPPPTFWRDLPLLNKTQHTSVGQSSFHCAICPCPPQATHTSCSAGDTCCESLQDTPLPPALVGLQLFRVVLFLIPAGNCMESFHFSFLNCCLLHCRKCNTVYNIIYCNWLYNLRIKITLHCARTKCFHWLLWIFPSRIIHEEYINVWFLIPIGTISRSLKIFVLKNNSSLLHCSG